MRREKGKEIMPRAKVLTEERGKATLKRREGEMRRMKNY
jgi:hypothetical protein